METVELAYDELGKNNPIPLIILHGFFASSRNWRQIAERLSALFHVYVLDLRNHGNSPHHATMDYQSMADDVLRFLDRHHIDKTHILGHSMGGKIAMWFGFNHPERIYKQVIVDIAPKAYSHNFEKLIQALRNLPLDNIQNRKQAEQLLAADIPELAYRQFLLQNLVLRDGHYQWRIDLTVFGSMAANIVAFPEMEHFLPYAGEALFIAGGDSNYLNQQDTLHLYSNATFTSIANVGHWLHVQQPEVFSEVVENFLQSGS